MLTTVHLWHLPPRRVPRALWHVAADRGRLEPQPLFAAFFGTGAGRTFTPADADVGTWGLVATWRHPADLVAFEGSAVAARWRRLAVETWRVDLECLRSRGRWRGARPFTPTRRAWSGPVAALTRARLVPWRMRRFWAAVPEVVADLHGGDGPLLSVGIGDAPIGLQGTFSVWPSVDALTAFAYSRGAHRRVARATPEQGWYAEELFARFAVLGETGEIFGAPVLHP